MTDPGKGNGSDSRQKVPVQGRKPVFTILSLGVSVAVLIFSGSLYSSGDGSGPEGVGAMLFGALLALFGLGPVLLFILIASMRRESMAEAKWLAVGISVLAILLLGIG